MLSDDLQYHFEDIIGDCSDEQGEQLGNLLARIIKHEKECKTAKPVAEKLKIKNRESELVIEFFETIIKVKDETYDRQVGNRDDVIDFYAEIISKQHNAIRKSGVKVEYSTVMH